ncbi:piggyBac transposable element-derived protein 4-like [Ixodes scapularis]|uniref:piggyBac transposable element-derived protein 4-like n=1 Tax=Ixodes scapularis TaxID=6945 RepID=UPI001A9DFF5B|nr:piggyBac transposable element-derived protein 4-like [Ixodes scapularis]
MASSGRPHDVCPRVAKQGKKRKQRAVSETSSSESDYELESDSGESLIDYLTSDESDTEIDDDFDTARVWTKIDVGDIPRAPPRFPFVGSPGFKGHLEEGDGAVEYFEQFFDEELVDLIVAETNRYATQFLRSHHASHIKTWRQINKKELMTFFALIILQGVIEKPDVKPYWSTREVLRTPAFGDVMSRDRFMLIMKFLHFTDNEAPVDGHPNPKLRKLWPVLTRMTEMFQTLYTPERDVSVDESLLRFKGRLSWKQYMPLKRARFGVKFFVLCESSSGYIWNMLMYMGKVLLLVTQMWPWVHVWYCP